LACKESFQLGFGPGLIVSLVGSFALRPVLPLGRLMLTGHTIQAVQRRRTTLSELDRPDLHFIQVVPKSIGESLISIGMRDLFASVRSAAPSSAQLSV
jgi:hypothetical protein